MSKYTQILQQNQERTLVFMQPPMTLYKACLKNVLKNQLTHHQKAATSAVSTHQHTLHSSLGQETKKNNISNLKLQGEQSKNDTKFLTTDFSTFQPQNELRLETN